jgi:hypothetical protein
VPCGDHTVHPSQSVRQWFWTHIVVFWRHKRLRSANPSRAETTSRTKWDNLGRFLEAPSTQANPHGAQAGSRAAEPPSAVREPLTPPSTVVE